jgi:broad specificity phosphatase PhoE
LVRHAQSEGNKNRDIHQYIPDHRVKLTAEGWLQAEDAGRRLRAMLRKEDTIRIFTSPYRRTRETTEGILRTLTEDNEEAGASPFQREDIKVYEVSAMLDCVSISIISKTSQGQYEFVRYVRHMNM